MMHHQEGTTRRTRQAELEMHRSPRSSTSDNLLQLNLRDHYEVLQELGRGTYGKVILARCKETNTKVALKLLPKSSTKLREFRREFSYSYFLSPHANILDTYNVAFETRGSYVFAQEYAPLGDLFETIPSQSGMCEKNAKCVIRQVCSALKFMHSNNLVHRDLKPENVLIFEPDLSRIKIMDFGMTRKDGTVIRKISGSIPYTPPEICEAVRNEPITISTKADVWAFGVLLFCMMTGNFPWENADIGDMYFNEFVVWQRRKTTRTPSQWRKFTPRIMKFFRKTLDIRQERRCSVDEIEKYMNDRWVVRRRSTTDSDEEEFEEVDDEDTDSGGDNVEDLNEKLQNFGVDTHMDKRMREKRISEWLLSL